MLIFVYMLLSLHLMSQSTIFHLCWNFISESMELLPDLVESRTGHVDLLQRYRTAQKLIGI